MQPSQPCPSLLLRMMGSSGPRLATSHLMVQPQHWSDREHVASWLLLLIALPAVSFVSSFPSEMMVLFLCWGLVSMHGNLVPLRSVEFCSHD